MLVPLTGCLAVLRSGGSSGTELQLRRQERDGAGNWKTVTRTASWDPRRTAVIVCDMWDDHGCPSFVSSDLTGGKAFRFAGDARRESGMDYRGWQ